MAGANNRRAHTPRTHRHTTRRDHPGRATNGINRTFDAVRSPRLPFGTPYGLFLHIRHRETAE
jgi:hypothetical protein